MSANQISGSGLQFRVGLQQIILSLSSDFMEQFITIGVTCKYKYEHENYHLLVIIHKYYSISIWYQDFTRLLSMAYTISQSCHSQTVFFSVSLSFANAFSCLALPGWAVNHREHTMCQISKETHHTHTQAYPDLTATTHLSATARKTEKERWKISFMLHGPEPSQRPILNLWERALRLCLCGRKSVWAGMCLTLCVCVAQRGRRKLKLVCD